MGYSLKCKNLNKNTSIRKMKNHGENLYDKGLGRVLAQDIKSMIYKTE